MYRLRAPPPHRPTALLLLQPLSSLLQPAGRCRSCLPASCSNHQKQAARCRCPPTCPLQPQGITYTSRLPYKQVPPHLPKEQGSRQHPSRRLQLPGSCRPPHQGGYGPHHGPHPCVDHADLLEGRVDPGIQRYVGGAEHGSQVIGLRLAEVLTKGSGRCLVGRGTEQNMEEGKGRSRRM